MPRQHSRLLLVFLLAVMGSARPSLGQMRPDAVGIAVAGNGNGMLGNYRSNSSGVALPDSPGATDLLKRASLEELQKHWDNAADLYQKAITQFPGRVVEVQRDSDGKACQSYWGLPRSCRNDWPNGPTKG